MEEKILKLDEVIVDNDLNPRQGALDQDAVLDYSAHVDDLPTMHCYDIMGFYYLTRGFHRYAAHRLAMRDEARFMVHQGSREEAKEDADLDNLKHGLRLSRSERREVIRRQLRRHPDWSDARLAGACSTTDKTVRVIREELEADLVIPRFDVLTGADGIARPRTISRPAPEPEPAGQQATLEITVASPLLKPVEELEEQQGSRGAGEQGGNEPCGWCGGEIRWVTDHLRGGYFQCSRCSRGSTSLVDLILAKPLVVPNTLNIGFEENQKLSQMIQAEGDDAGEDLPDQTEVRDDNDSEEPEEILPGEPAEAVRPVEPAPTVAPPPLPAPLPSSLLPPPPAPTVREAAWILSISVPPGAPPLVTVLHGATPMLAIPADVAERVCAAIRAKVEAPANGDGEAEAAPVEGPEWLEA